ncbi:MAG: TrkA family potassium uptake protein [Spirochaetes bacterium]|nr:MAG: TrkA family potassium uptake protein [Spirochaetota bacterium]
MKQFAVFGLGVFGESVAKNLMKEGMEVIVVDTDERRIETIKNDVTEAAIMDSTKEEALLAIDISRVDCAIVCIGDNMEASILTSLLLKKLEVPKIIARANSEAHRQILSLIGVDEIISPEEEMGLRLARRLSSTHILHHLDISEEHTIAEVLINDNFVGKTLRELNLRSRFGVNVVGIKKKIPHVTENGENVFIEKYVDFPSPDDVFEEGDVLVMVGSERAISEVEKFIERGE